MRYSVGALSVTVTVANAADQSRSDSIDLLVDTGATFTVLPPELCERLGVAAEFTRRLRTADGRVLERDQGLAYVKVDGYAATVPVIVGGNGVMPVLGVTSLEILGLAFDPVRRELVPSEHLYLTAVAMDG